MAKIVINGEEYNARQTAGALMDAKQELGFDPLFEHNKMDFQAMTVLTWCALRATARTNGGQFNMTLQDFADRVTLPQLTQWFAEENPPLKAGTEPTAKKN